MRLAGKIAVVTGAASGIGRGTAVRFAEEGADLALADVQEEGLQETARQVRELGRRVLVQPTDVRDRAQVARLLIRTVEDLGGLDILVANAGVGSAEPFLEATDEQYDRILDTNLRGVYLCGQEAARIMVERGIRGSIINTASTYAEVTAPRSSIYSASKGGVRMLTKGMAVELGQYGIRVNCIGPGWIRTGMNPLTDEARVSRILEGVPLGRVGTPRDVAGAALFLASDDAAYVTGTIIFVDGGWILQ
ncbi:MAG TPA: SDR family NAD(P)-dependent oxidoreductase [Chloroflexota bacterium]|jgi:NAD(P)-dependent dehydrogenase (short-subunit alcohol dehydrogenase family)|nr:SDR family NAD(P)-dependent oxidoreductase [Chloroflexota bacterium]